MSKTNGVKSQASASTSPYSKEHNLKQRQYTSGFPTFLKWFKKSDRNQQRQLKTNGIISSVNSQYSDSHDTLSPPSSPILDNLSPSSSCDSILSTSTTGFAFIKPQTYESYKNIQELKLLTIDDSKTGSYNRRLSKYNFSAASQKRPEINLRRKYFLYDTDTLASNDKSDTGYDNIDYFDRSLPNVKNKSNSQQSTPHQRRHRRTVSDSSKDKRSGAYVHVKGKRKAPPPPPLLNGTLPKNDKIYEFIEEQNNYELLSPGSTLGRKKRRAPPPPTSPKSPTDEIPNPILFEGLLDDKEIKAIIEGTNSDLKRSNLENPTMPSNIKRKSKDLSELKALSEQGESNEKHIPPKINLESVQSNQESETHEDIHKFPAPTSPISPRPWYKRPISSNRDSAIPFKREIVLKTMEKRKNKQKEKESIVSSILPEVGYSRSSLFDAGHKFGFFMRHKETSDSKDRDKRRSGIGIPNISELDREAAEIVNKEHANEMAKEKAEREKFFNPPEHLVLQQQMFEGKKHKPQEDTAQEREQVVSTKDLISKFESSSNVTRITLNTSFVGRADLFYEKDKDAKGVEDAHKISQESQKVINKPVTEISKPQNIFSNSEEIRDSKIDDKHQNAATGSPQSVQGVERTISKEANDSLAIKTTWNCPFCTLENPRWRIICEACEKLKPFDKAKVKEDKSQVHKLPLKANPSTAITLKIKEPENLAQTTVHDRTKDSEKDGSPVKIDNMKINSSTDWEKKAEKVKKYFMPRTNINVLSKSSSETTVGKRPPIFRKSPSPSKLPVSSPSFARRNRLQNVDIPERFPLSNFSSKIPEGKETNTLDTEKKQPLLDSSVVITTVTPVFYATTAIATTDSVEPSTDAEKSQDVIDLKQVRNARLEKFMPKSQNPAPTSIENRIIPHDADSLEREKQRLREKIRAMNAKALAEKYPVLQKASQLDEDNKPVDKSSDKEAQEGSKFGAIKKVFNRTHNSENTKIVEKGINTDLLPQRKGKSQDDDATTRQEKPKKVSTSAQTSGFLKSTGQADYKFENNFSNIMTYENQLFDSTTKNNDQYIREFSEYDKAKVQEISQQLQSQEGIKDFKATLKDPVKGISHTDTLALNKIMRNLELAIAEGKDDLAARIAVDLAKMKVSLQVTKVKERPTSSGIINYNRNIIIDLFVEDKISQKGPIQMTVKPLMTILELKEKALRDFDIPIELQRWLINSEPAPDNEKTLLEHGVHDCSSKFYLYITTPDTKSDKKDGNLNFTIPNTSIAVLDEIDLNLSDKSSDSHNDLDVLQGAMALRIDDKSRQEITALSIDGKNLPHPTPAGWQCPLCTVINPFHKEACFVCSKAKPKDVKEGQKEKALISEKHPDSSHGAAALPVNDKNAQQIKPQSWQCSLCTLINSSDKEVCFACSKARPKDVKKSRTENLFVSDELQQFLQSQGVTKRNSFEKKNDLNKTNPNRKSSEIFNIVEEQAALTPSTNNSIADAVKPTTNFASPNITKNKYRGVDNFNPNRKSNNESKPTQTQVKREKPKAPQPPTNSPTTNHYLELLKLDHSDIVPNKEEFECPVCFTIFAPGEGVVLRDCLHTFCRECLSNTVRYSEEAEVKCPFMDAQYSCDSILQEREIKSIVAKEIYEQHLAKSVRVAEHQIENAFHCKTPNCRGWCIYEDNVNEFKCPVCRITNCLMCRVIHDGLTCKQYQDRLNSDCDSNLEARRTKDMIQEMVEKGEAMNCPTCQVIMMKKWGCDWLKCSMCKTEVCWVTRGPRWGPGGKGDTSGGCKCGVDGKKCHPKCNYCH